MWRALHHHPYDVVFSTTRFFLTSLLAWRYVRQRKKPWVHIEHGSTFVVSPNPLVVGLSRLYDHTLGRRLFRVTTMTVAPSRSAQTFIRKFDSRRCALIYRGIDYETIDRIAPEQTLRQRYGNRVIITFAGRFIASKGIADLIVTATHLPRHSFVILLLGDGGLRRQWELQVYTRGLADTIFFYGHQSFQQVISIFKGSDIIVNPSYNEGLPTTILEAAACERAIVATNVGGTSEIISHGRSGLLVAPGDIPGLAQALRQLIDNKILRHQFGRQARIDVERTFNWEMTARQYEKIIRRYRRA